MFLTFLARMLPALSVAKPACIRKISAPVNGGRVLSARDSVHISEAKAWQWRTRPHQIEGVQFLFVGFFIALDFGDVTVQVLLPGFELGDGRLKTVQVPGHRSRLRYPLLAQTALGDLAVPLSVPANEICLSLQKRAQILHSRLRGNMPFLQRTPGSSRN